MHDHGKNPKWRISSYFHSSFSTIYISCYNWKYEETRNFRVLTCNALFRTFTWKHQENPNHQQNEPHLISLQKTGSSLVLREGGQRRIHWLLTHHVKGCLQGLLPKINMSLKILRWNNLAITLQLNESY